MKAVEHDNRGGSPDTPYGFVYFDDGKRVQSHLDKLER